ncbi:STAS domain-containing protein [Streptomyces sp. NPDC004111]|uniref:STAS domain-containing protein n=1 Tax=Streptomyces sp. NPDC004111 TaxID=3364690 RepID=UPI0036A6B85C
MTYGAPPATGHLHTYRAHGHTVVELRGDIDIAAAQFVLPHLDVVSAPPETLLVVDLTPVTFFDCSGLALLCRTHRRVHERGGQLLVVCPHPLILKIMGILDLTEHFRPAPTLHAALRRPGPVPGAHQDVRTGERTN